METDTSLPSNQGNLNTEQQNWTDEDNFEMDTDVRQINIYLQEVKLERELEYHIV